MSRIKAAVSPWHLAIEFKANGNRASLANDPTRSSERRSAATRLYPSRIICPVEQCLPLSSAAVQVTIAAVLLYLCDVPSDGPPSTDLTLIVTASPAHIVPAVPLKPSARIFARYPAFLPPMRKRLRSVHAKIVQTRVVAFMT
jgi:hypothetical protein